VPGDSLGVVVLKQTAPRRLQTRSLHRGAPAAGTSRKPRAGPEAPRRYAANRKRDRRARLSAVRTARQSGFRRIPPHDRALAHGRSRLVTRDSVSRPSGLSLAAPCRRQTCSWRGRRPREDATNRSRDGRRRRSTAQGAPQPWIPSPSAARPPVWPASARGSVEHAGERYYIACGRDGIRSLNYRVLDHQAGLGD